MQYGPCVFTSQRLCNTLNSLLWVRHLVRVKCNCRYCVNIFGSAIMCLCVCVCSALVKLLNKSIEGTADDDDEGVTPDTAIRAGLELLKVLFLTSNALV